ncbi:MAG: hypothetical protein BLM47_11225 [Candidatus Reconcilbacillus cellulovorans]|uniref:M23ase beta-sheet core domain-containing protein n=1 Tax=Candidatus Reconcilbacillus cellulovorans TaxID=1906605 RepID=A0A2A6DXZ5_9BACL|nr:MAG: hypothetical protein BLM47_11225 [Candidatus Reconcilbacillus cellulovorans]
MEHTVIWIRDAHRPAVRLRLRPSLLIGTLVLFLVLVLVAAVLSVLCYRLWSDRQQLERTLEEETARFHRSSAEQMRRIEQLEAEMAQLSRQAEEIGRRIAEMEKLETSLRSITGPNSRLQAGSGQGGPEPEPATAPIGEAPEAGGSIETDYDAFARRTRDLSDRLASALHLLRSTPHRWPTDSRDVSSPFGYRKDPFTGRKTFHTGVDIAASFGDPVYATADGRVAETGSDRVRGRFVVLDHKSGLQTAYLHLSRIAVAEGDSVAAGDVIGFVGSTGRSTGPHLHYEVMRDGWVVDPNPYLPD